MAAINLTAGRILLVWINSCIGDSLLVTMLMHASFTGSTLFTLSSAATGGPLAVFNPAVAVAVWIVVAAIALIYQKSKEEKNEFAQKTDWERGQGHAVYFAFYSDRPGF